MKKAKRRNISDRAATMQSEAVPESREEFTEVVVSVTDKRHIELFNKLRGAIPTREFAVKCFETGLKVAELQSKQKVERVEFIRAKPEFMALDAEAVTTPLKAKDPQHPITVEVGRLVNAYSGQLRDAAKRNGNLFPVQIKIGTVVPIERVAFQITSAILKGSTRGVKSPDDRDFQNGK